MLAKLVGYNEVEYSKNGQSHDFVVVYVASDKVITFGSEYLTCILSPKYWEEKIAPAFQADRDVHIGFDKKKDNKPFLYVKS